MCAIVLCCVFGSAVSAIEHAACAESPPWEDAAHAVSGVGDGEGGGVVYSVGADEAVAAFVLSLESFGNLTFRAAAAAGGGGGRGK